MNLKENQIKSSLYTHSHYKGTLSVVTVGGAYIIGMYLGPYLKYAMVASCRKRMGYLIGSVFEPHTSTL